MTMKNKQKVYKFPREPIPLHKNLRNLYPSLVYIHVACVLKTLIFTWLGGRGGGSLKNGSHVWRSRPYWLWNTYTHTYTYRYQWQKKSYKKVNKPISIPHIKHVDTRAPALAPKKVAFSTSWGACCFRQLATPTWYIPRNPHPANEKFIIDRS